MNREKADAIKKSIVDFSGIEECAVKRPKEGDIQTRKVSIGHGESNVQKMRREIQSVVANGVRLSPSAYKLDEVAFRWQMPALEKEIREKQKEIVKNIVATKKSLEADFEKLRNIKVTEKMLDDIVASISLSDESLEVYRKTGNICESGIKPQSKNKFDSIKKSIYNGIGQKGQEEGNGLWLINGVTTYFQNDAKYKSEEKKFESITKGSAKNKLQYVYDSLMA